MKHYYYVNKDDTHNPGLHHEVHTQQHMIELHIINTITLGEFDNEIEAVQSAKRYYLDADGCAICCPRAHKG